VNEHENQNSNHNLIVRIQYNNRFPLL